MRRLALALALCLCAAGPAAAYCRLALSLAIDVSSSVDEGEYRLQKDGLVAALGHPKVVEGFLAVPGGFVTLHVYEWSGRYQQDVILDWTEIRSAGDVAKIQARLVASDRTYAEFPTAIGYALAFATFEFRRAPRCDRKTVDVSGDGVNNDGFPPFMAARNHDFSDTTVNGLVIGADEALFDFYENYVIMGDGAFVERANDFADFEAAMVRKLVRELGVPQLGMRIRDLAQEPRAH